MFPTLKRPHNDPPAEMNKRQKVDGYHRYVCPTQNPHTCKPPSGAVSGKKKYYCIWGGPNPGIHYTSWDVARKWAEGVGPVKQRSMGDVGEAMRFYAEQKRSFPELVSKRPDQETRSDLPGIRSPSRSLSLNEDQCDLATSPPPASDSKVNVTSSVREETKPLVPGPPSVKEETQPLVPGPLSIKEETQPLVPGPLSVKEEAQPLVLGPHGQAITPLQDFSLSAEQARLVNLIVNDRKNVFYTGPAGVGKSRVLKAFRTELAAKGLKVNVVAPTGRAALEVNGSTTWSFAGWTPGSMKRSLKDLQNDAWKKTVKKRLKQTDVLVIDEISMVENLHLERLSSIMKDVRQDKRAFGGVQVVVTGDFCQLPPVNPFGNCLDCGKPLAEKAKKSAYECFDCDKIYNDEDKWAFRSEAWREANFEHINLETVFRQKDRNFIDILQKLRLGKILLPEDRRLLCQSKPSIDKATKLYPLREDVKRVNEVEFKKLKTELHLYHSKDNFERQPHHGAFQLYNDRAADDTLVKLAEHRYEPHLELKEGMLVVLLANISPSEGLVNGSQGTIVGFEDFWSKEDELKSDTERITAIEVTLEGDYKEYRATRILEFMMAAPRKQWPIVRFVHRGMLKTLAIKASCYPTEVGDEPVTNPRYSLLSRTQIPLMAAWAMTIHKSQGMTLEKVEVDLSKNFEEGMAYVALSRATSLEGLRVISFPESAEKGCNEEVWAFLKEKFNIE